MLTASVQQTQTLEYNAQLGLFGETWPAVHASTQNSPIAAFLSVAVLLLKS